METSSICRKVMGISADVGEWEEVNISRAMVGEQWGSEREKWGNNQPKKFARVELHELYWIVDAVVGVRMKAKFYELYKYLYKSQRISATKDCCE